MYIKGFRQKHKWNYYIRWGFVLLSLAGLVGCSLEPMNVEQNYPPCQPNQDNANIYKNPTPHPLVSSIYQSYSLASSNPASTPQIPVSGQDTLRSFALTFLIEEVKRWSNVKVIKLDDFSDAYIRITFLNPDLMQAIYLNEKLKQAGIVSEFEKQVSDAVNKISLRNELLFLVTISFYNRYPSQPTRHHLDIDVSNLKLTNTENLPVSPLHDDHNLDELIDSTQGAISGLIGYPLGLQVDKDCIWVLNPQFNTNIVIVMQSLLIDTNEKETYTWTIPYMPLIDAGNDLKLSDPVTLQTNDLGIFFPITTPPTNIELSVESEVFWRDYARFVWGYLTLDGK
ncbi:MAG TPA: hypothetical protein PK530_23825 [Anaerolineales bacterium]|nr:hypothetical protein [Anaerolineales bacterium]HNK62549.1 hypothetical protein [Anaerolineales bacterium]